MALRPGPTDPIDPWDPTDPTSCPTCRSGFQPVDPGFEEAVKSEYSALPPPPRPGAGAAAPFVPLGRSPRRRNATFAGFRALPIPSFSRSTSWPSPRSSRSSPAPSSR
jgi:hypothetical protein